MKLFSYSLFGLMAIILSISVGTALAQGNGVRASQKGAVSQVFANTEISIEYSRPSKKGRILFGPKGIVKYAKIWIPGANEASNIKFSNNVLINDKPVNAGRYSIWTIPGEKEWTLIFSKDWDQWHTQYPGKDEDALRILVKPIEGTQLELMTFYFPLVTSNSATINLHWGKTIIPFEIRLNDVK